ncbi:zincin-like metallopeptidase domain-containing protein [Acidisphaera sp. L21]|uniref:zincin-like metallopeptidase domain-containing protein n=1 Tax=Acidisphaera sp. L21 TaxID=1641851 RepID=UPI00131B6250
MILQNRGAAVRVGKDRTFYSPQTDHIQLPSKQEFAGRNARASVMLRKLLQWSRHESRLDRDLRNRFVSNAYAAEDLRAELDSVFMARKQDSHGTSKPSKLASRLHY